MSTEPTNLTKLSVNITPRTLAALEAAAEQSGDTKTDVVNRAVQIYAWIVKAGNEGHGSITVNGSTPDGIVPVRIKVKRVRRWFW